MAGKIEPGPQSGGWELQGKELKLYPLWVRMCYLMVGIRTGDARTTVLPPLPRSGRLGARAAAPRNGVSVRIAEEEQPQGKHPDDNEGDGSTTAAALGGASDGADGHLGHSVSAASVGGASAHRSAAPVMLRQRVAPSARDVLEVDAESRSGSFVPQSPSPCARMLMLLTSVAALVEAAYFASLMLSHGKYDATRNAAITVLLVVSSGIMFLWPATIRLLSSGLEQWLFKRGFAEASAADYARWNKGRSGIAFGLLSNTISSVVLGPLVMLCVVSCCFWSFRSTSSLAASRALRRDLTDLYDTDRDAFWSTAIIIGVIQITGETGALSSMVPLLSINHSFKHLCAARLRWMMESRPTRRQAQAVYFEIEYVLKVISDSARELVYVAAAFTSLDILMATWYLVSMGFDYVPVVYFVGCTAFAMSIVFFMSCLTSHATEFTNEFLLVFDQLPASDDSEQLGFTSMLDVARDHHPGFDSLASYLSTSSSMRTAGEARSSDGFLLYVSRRPLGIRIADILISKSQLTRMAYVIFAMCSVIVRSTVLGASFN